MARALNGGAALRSLALRLRAGEAPYYLSRPRSEHEPAPGWYWRPQGAEQPVYLAANHYDAYVKLTLRLNEMREQQLPVPSPPSAAA